MVGDIVRSGIVSPTKINEIIKKNFGSGLRKQDLQKIVRDLLNKPKRKTPEKKEKKDVYITMYITKIIDTPFYEDVFLAEFKNVMKMTKKEIEQHIVNSLKQLGNEKKRYVSMNIVKTPSEKDGAVILSIASKKDDFAFGMTFKKTRQKEILAFLYTSIVTMSDSITFGNISNILDLVK